ncbi:hypothetical protein [Chryseobacterium gambrini]|uniref:Uncharacterized protein n=1 Tax=Chryseobacterium gambrini TaxID=373672 RepID=A0A1N7PBJ5_9FLAO|nr:hypothetical protein [Chryseobacterium gambrini]SIT07799.1 hypothetical protein SAMN05421785_106122 [Chryseobacterium gambrini]
MKNKLKFFLLLALLFSLQSKAQLDTLNYLKQFEINKANYIGRPFTNLLVDMQQIKPKMIWISPIYHGVRKYIDKTFFCFDEKFPFNYNERTFNTNSNCLQIVWENYIDPRSSEYILLTNKNRNHFTKDERVYYGKKIIKDIKVYR